MSLQQTSPAAVALLTHARRRIAHGWPSFEHALARTATRTAEEMLRAAAALRDAEAPGEKAQAPVEVRALAEAQRWVETARAHWGFDEARAPRLAPGEPHCFSELRFLLERAEESRAIPFEDSDGLERAQAVCILTLALLLLQADAWG